MHALIVTFRSGVDPEQLARPFQDFARALTDVPGFRTKAWLAQGDTLGGFYLFDDPESVEAYLASEMVAQLRATEGFDDFEVRTFDVLADLSAMTGVGTAGATR